MKIPLYRAELEVEGLAEKIRANSSVAYCSRITKADVGEKVIAKIVGENARASMDDIDLYYTKSILVSTNWNKNDDVFDKDEVWYARNSPSHKRTNIEHDEKKIVGHMTEVWPIDAEGNVIADDTAIDDLPDLYHLVNGAVIYRKWDDEDYSDTVGQLIEDIEKGEMFVSMEALFFDFDYAVITKAGDFHIIDRSKETSFLTKYLKAYGGKGEYDDCKIGRLLKKIIFSGKGYVKKPANDSSVIILGEDETALAFSSAKTNNPFSADKGVFIIASETKPNEMENMMDEKLKKELEDKVAALEAEIVSANQKVLAEQAKVTELTVANTQLVAEKSDLEKTVASTVEAKTQVEAQLVEIKTKATKVARVSKLTTKGFEQAEAETKVDLFVNLSDEQFDVVAEAMTKTVKAEETVEQVDNQAADNANTALESVDTSKTEVVPAVPPVTTDLVIAKEELRSAIAAFLSGTSVEKKN